MEENWIVYPCLIDDAPAVTGVDLAFTNSAPDEERPRALRIAVGLLDTQDNGLPQGDEFDQLEEIENGLVEALARTGAVFVGRRTHAGERLFYFYGPAGDSAHTAAAAGVLDALDERECSVGATDDPDWEIYYEDLIPDPMEMRHVLDQMVVEQLEQAGDPLTVARPVTHFIYFPTEATRDAFAAHASTLGFAPVAFEDEGSDDEPVEEDERFGLQLERRDAVDLESINEVTSTLMTAADEAGGRYDGWEAMVIDAGEGA